MVPKCMYMVNSIFWKFNIIQNVSMLCSHLQRWWWRRWHRSSRTSRRRTMRTRAARTDAGLRARHPCPARQCPRLRRRDRPAIHPLTTSSIFLYTRIKIHWIHRIIDYYYYYYYVMLTNVASKVVWYFLKW